MEMDKICYSISKQFKVNTHYLSITYSDMFKVLAKFVRSSDNLTLCNPLLEVLNLTVQLVQLENFTQLVTSLKRKVLQTRVEFIHL